MNNEVFTLELKRD